MRRSEEITNHKSKAARWLCKCDCGRLHVVLGHILRAGLTKSCGCLIRCRRTRPYESAYNNLTHDYKNRGHKVDLTYEEFVAFSNVKLCHYCWAEVGWAPYDGSRIHLDRKDNTLGYSTQNCVVCCKRCNFGKNRYFTYEEWWGMTEFFRRGLTCLS
jgi:hypothetical protein